MTIVSVTRTAFTVHCTFFRSDSSYEYIEDEWSIDYIETKRKKMLSLYHEKTEEENKLRSIFYHMRYHTASFE